MNFGPVNVTNRLRLKQSIHHNVRGETYGSKKRRPAYFWQNRHRLERNRFARGGGGIIGTWLAYRPVTQITTGVLEGVEQLAQVDRNWLAQLDWPASVTLDRRATPAPGGLPTKIGRGSPRCRICLMLTSLKRFPHVTPLQGVLQKKVSKTGGEN